MPAIRITPNGNHDRNHRGLARLSQGSAGDGRKHETIRQSRADGVRFVKLIQDMGIVPGIKVDTGAKDLAGHPGEKVTEGLDGLRERLRDYSEMGARFAKWRAGSSSAQGDRAAPAWRPTPTRWRAARRLASCRSSSWKPSWRAIIPWRLAPRRPKTVLRVSSEKAAREARPPLAPPASTGAFQGRRLALRS